MFVIGNLIKAIANLASTLIYIYTFIVLVSALLSWVNVDPYNSIVRILRGLTEPLFFRVRKWLPFVHVGGMDLSPLVVLLVLQFVNMAVVDSLLMFGTRLILI